MIGIGIRENEDPCLYKGKYEETEMGSQKTRKEVSREIMLTH